MSSKLIIYSTVFVFSALVWVMLLSQKVQAAESGIVISEISMGSSLSATDEFVELYNNSSTPVSVANWSIYYRSATGSTYSKKASFFANSNISAHGFYLASTLSPNNVSLISGMSQTGGVVELRDDKGNVIDRVGYGNANLSTGKPAIAAQAGESIYRQYDSPNFQMINTLDNFSDFYIATTPTPNSIPVAEIEEISEPLNYPTIFINELYPNPTSSQSESEDEYIELYNPNNSPLDLSGWLIKDSSGKTYIIKNSLIAPGGFAVFYSSETHISLNNTGDIVSLYSPAGDLKDQSTDYGDAKEGLSWGVVSGIWDWNNSLTPAALNSTAYVETVAIKASSSKTTKKVAAKKAAAKKASTKKPKAAKLKATKAQASKGDNNSQNDENQLQSKFANFWPILLIILGTGTIGYGIYEYKPEITSFYMRAKNKFTSGR